MDNVLEAIAAILAIAALIAGWIRNKQGGGSAARNKSAGAGLSRHLSAGKNLSSVLRKPKADTPTEDLSLRRVSTDRADMVRCSECGFVQPKGNRRCSICQKKL